MNIYKIKIYILISTIKINFKYLGTYFEEKRKINLCGFHQEWNKVTEELKKSLNNGDLNKNCK